VHDARPGRAFHGCRPPLSRALFKEDPSMADLAAIGIVVGLAAIVLSIAFSLEKL
jgi:hypothetical protein